MVVSKPKKVDVGGVSVPDIALHCSCCGKRVDDSYAVYQYKEFGLTEGTMCEECTSWDAELRLKRFPTDKIEEALDDDDTESWKSMSPAGKVIMCYRLIKEGVIEIGEVE